MLSKVFVATQLLHFHIKGQNDSSIRFFWSLSWMHLSATCLRRPACHHHFSSMKCHMHRVRYLSTTFQLLCRMLQRSCYLEGKLLSPQVTAPSKVQLSFHCRYIAKWNVLALADRHQDCRFPRHNLDIWLLKRLILLLPYPDNVRRIRKQVSHVDTLFSGNNDLLDLVSKWLHYTIHHFDFFTVYFMIRKKIELLLKIINS